MRDDVPFYGRTRELEEMERLLDGVLEGRTCTAFVSGEAGAGKSTLVEAFVERAQKRDSALIATLAACNSHTGQSDAYLPFLDTLAQLTGDSRRFKSGSISEMNAHRLESFFTVATRAIVEDVPELIGQFIPGGSLIFHTISFTARKAGLLDRHKRRKLQAQIGGKIEADKIFQLYADLLAKLATHAPLVVVLEDLHWVDQSSAQLLFSLSRRIVDAPILFLGTYRPNDLAVGRSDGRHPLVPVIHELKRVHGDIFVDLAEETEAERVGFVDAMLETEVPGLGPDFRRAFLEHTEGHALFSRELLHSLRENRAIAASDSGRWEQTKPIDWSDIPPRVEGVVQERVDRLDEELRDMATVASVQGESFLVEILARLTDLPVRKVLRSLSRQLEGIHGLVVEVDPLKIDTRRLGRYRFTHGLFQQYLYDELGLAERRQLHLEVAELLEGEYGDARSEIQNRLAYHFAAAEAWDRAVPYYVAAARRSLAVSSYGEALELLHTALDATSELPAGDRAGVELAIRLELGTIHQALRGFTDPTAEESFRRARDLAMEIGDRPRLALALFGLWEFHLFRLELEEALALAERILQIAREEDDNILRVVAHRALANVAYQRGDMAGTIHHADEVIRHYQAEEIGDYILRLTYDPRLFALGMRSWAEALTGEPERAEATLESLFEWAQELDHPVSTCVAHLSALKLHHHLGNLDEIGSHATAMRQLAEEYGLFWYTAFGRFFEFWHGALSEGAGVDAAAFEEAFDRIYRAGVAPDGNLLIHSQYSRMLVEALLEFGALQRAADAVDKGIAVARSNGEHVYLGELTRLRGQILLEGGDADRAVADLRTAAERSRESGQRLLELRARATLCTALEAAGQPAGEAEAELHALVDSFGGQADHLDVRAARGRREAR